ncbi:MAG TPA: alpha/beta hydrolase [Acidimicrobiia bacterium]|nr:alpha/beta hydrolase [Acidimicrobiia bacterium]
MTGLRPPPKAETTSRVFLRFVVLVVLLIAVAAAIWTTVTLDRIELIEDVALEDVEHATVVTAGDTVLNVVRSGEGTVPLVLLHDVDVAGGVLWDGVAAELDPRFSVMRVDLPGFGLSERIPQEGSRHTVASMAEEVADAIRQTFDQPAVVAGVGLGGEVAAEIAVTQPDLLAGLVMVDVDFYKPREWDEFVERLPWFGTAATYALETGGPLADGRWAPNCESGGWCPTPSQIAARDLAETIVDTSESIHFFRRTPAASQVPSKLGEITTPTFYLWSQAGEVPRESVDRVQEAMPAATVEVVADAWKVHLDTPGVVAATVAGFLQ